MTGIGKTQLLLNGLKRAKELPNAKAAYFTFNGQGNLKEALPEHLMASQGLNLKRCLRSLWKFMSALDHEHIVLFIDELGLLDEDLPKSQTSHVIPLLKALMQYMDVVEHKVTRCSQLFRHPPAAPAVRGASALALRRAAEGSSQCSCAKQQFS